MCDVSRDIRGRDSRRTYGNWNVLHTPALFSYMPLPAPVANCCHEEKQRAGKSALRKERHSQRNGVYFVTVVAHQRENWFEDHATARAMCRQLHRFDTRQSGKMLCWVVMPDHIHFLFQLGEIDLGKIVQRLKAGSATSLNRLLGRKGQFWESGFYDHGLRHERDARGIARYIVANPLRAKLVERVGDYPFWNAIWL